MQADNHTRWQRQSYHSTQQYSSLTWTVARA
jgi:hypothetical protein